MQDQRRPVGDAEDDDVFARPRADAHRLAAAALRADAHRRPDARRRVAERAAGCAWPGTMKVMSLVPLAMDAPRLTRATARAGAHQTLNGFCARNSPAAPSVNRFGDCVAGMRALMRAWKLP